MKNFKILAIVMLFATTGVFASSMTNLVDTPDVPVKEIRSQIVDLLNDVNFRANQDMIVQIKFTFNSVGELIVLRVDTRHQDVLNFVREHINQKKIANPGKRNKIYSMPLKIKGV